VFEFGEPKASSFKLGRHLCREIGARFDLPGLDIQKFAHGSRRLRLEGELLGRFLEQDPGNLSRGRPARGRDDPFNGFAALASIRVVMLSRGFLASAMGRLPIERCQTSRSRRKAQRTIVRRYAQPTKRKGPDRCTGGPR
jgi:hypothetical protein